ncbi:MAG: VWA domain-containing protein [Alphaproteobacteria bacterium]|nr:VWA domain-containing protein [Alphaproteobacteria bacterium]
MNIFIWPWAVLFLFLPFLARKILPARVGSKNTIPLALRVPFFNRLSSFLVEGKPQSNRKIAWLLALSWVAFVVACMRPVVFDEALTLPYQARNIMLTIDVSGSMAEQDFDINGRPVTRLTMVKKMADDFIQKRSEDNLGLVIFGSKAYLYAPLSYDKKTLRSLFNEVGIGIAGEQTAIGDALAQAVKGVVSAPSDSRVVILLSDGYANAGAVKVDEAIELAKKQKVKVYTIGIGSNEQLVRSFFGTMAVNPSLNLDEKMLTQIAEQTDGQYFRAKTTAELQDIYNVIDALEKADSDTYAVRPRHELFYIPLIVSMILLMMSAILKRRQA